MEIRPGKLGRVRSQKVFVAVKEGSHRAVLGRRATRCLRLKYDFLAPIEGEPSVRAL